MGFDSPSLEKSPEKSKKAKENNFDEFLHRYRVPLVLVLVGAILIGFGILFAKDGINTTSNTVEVLESATEGESISSEIVVEVSGAVEHPGVYRFDTNARIEDALISAGGVSADADREWMEKFLNRAAKIIDGQKIYIVRVGENAENSSSDSGKSEELNTGGVAGISTININTATNTELESLWGIGPVYAQNIIEQRPYSSVEELLTRKIIKSNVYERNKEHLSIY